MSRPLEIAPEETSFDEAAMLEYIDGQSALEEEATSVQEQYTDAKGKIEEHRKKFQGERKLCTEAIDFVRKLINSKSPKKRYAFLRTMDTTRRLLNADDQADMFSDHIDEGEAKAIKHAAA